MRTSRDAPTSHKLLNFISIAPVGAHQTFGTKEMINYPIIIAAALVFLAFVAHTFVGTREALSTRPRKLQTEEDNQAEKIERSWVQSLCAFHLVTVDLLALTLLLFFLGISDTFSARKEIAMIAAVFLPYGLLLGSSNCWH